jgi:pyruvate/2-oxoacid:ferredoxin oxidoreductase beta subunit
MLPRLSRASFIVQSCYRFHGLHGRVIPFAAGAKLANMKVSITAFGGDGATFSKGIGHLIHGVRGNYPITFVLHNNTNYGPTTGQASSLTPQGQPMNKPQRHPRAYASCGLSGGCPFGPDRKL